jgi:LuxR family transcriptional regulator, maltose regulon positive regulatory protein
MSLIEPHSPPSNEATGTGPFLGGKQVPFLVTKVVSPRRLGLIDRPRLLAVASQLAAKRLAVIKAPAGFGKTSLAASWSEWLRQHGNLVAWLTIDPDDDEPARFLFYMVQAIQRCAPGVGGDAIDLINEAFLVNPQAIVSTLINDLTDVDDEVYLFLEDYHWIADPVIHEAVAFFLRHAPSHAHVVLTTRTEPPLPLASLRANNQLLEVDAAALRFDLQETHEFLLSGKPDSLDLEDVRLLHSRTEGWPAALRIIVATSSAGEGFGQYVRNLTGVQRPIGSYLDEMLDGLPGELVSFMLRTAILDRLSVPLCKVVSGEVSSQALLASIEKRQLLLTALDQEGKWFRYHPLLAEHLKKRLLSELGDEFPELHRRAAHWYASQELWTEAVQHAIAAGDTDQALGWIKNCAMGLVKRGDLLTLLDWQHLFPSEVMSGQPAVKLAIAWGLALAARVDDALQILDEIEHDLATHSPADRDLLACECEAIRSVALSLKDEGQVALPLALNCMSKSNDPWTANVASNVVRYWRCRIGDLEGFYATPWIPYSIDEDRRNVFASVYRRCIQGIAEVQQLRLAAAERHYTEASRLAEQYVGPNSIAAALPASLIARIFYEQGRVDEAETMLVDRLPLISAGAMPECVLNSNYVMVRVAAFRSNFDRAHTLLERADSFCTMRSWGRLCAAVALERVWLYLREDRVNEAAVAYEHLERLAERYHPSVDFSWSDIHRYAALARAYLASARGHFDHAISTLTDLRDDTDRARNYYFALRVAVHLSVVQFSASHTAEALGSLRRTLDVSAQAGIHQTFLDEGPKIGPLLIAFQETAERSSDKSAELVPYVSGLVTAWRSRYQTTAAPSDRSRLTDPLSAREAAILKLIAQGLSNKEIARNLAITPETVKSHVKHIFIKLGSEKRAQAVARAQSLGLITTH